MIGTRVLDWKEGTEADIFIKTYCRELINLDNKLNKEADNNIIRLAQQMLKYNIDERITMSAALDHEFFALLTNRKSKPR